MQRRQLLIALLAVASVTVAAALVGFRPTAHPIVPSGLGTPSSTEILENSLATPGPVQVESIAAADWAVERGGLLNLDHPRAKAAGLHGGDEPVQIYFHALRHPKHGLFIVDTGVERALRDDPERAVLRGLVGRVMRVDRLRLKQDTASWLAGQPEPLAGVLLTHLHLDHIAGLPDVPKGTPIYVGSNEATDRSFVNLLVRPSIDAALADHAPLRELRHAADPTGVFDGVLDLFGDQSVFALWVPGHTAGSTAYLARTPEGPVLLVGDACHTAWGWENGVEPGSFSADPAKGAASLQRLRAFAEKHRALRVRLGHQPLGPDAAETASSR